MPVASPLASGLRLLTARIENHLDDIGASTSSATGTTKVSHRDFDRLSHRDPNRLSRRGFDKLSHRDPNRLSRRGFDKLSHRTDGNE